MRLRAQSKSSTEDNWSVTRRSFAGLPASLQVQRVGRSQRAAAHRVRHPGGMREISRGWAQRHPGNRI